MNIRTQRLVRSVASIFMASILAMPLSGCAEKDKSDLDGYVEEVLARASRKIEPLPQIKPYRVYAYRSGSEKKKSPFLPFFTLPSQDSEALINCKPGVDPGCISPDQDRNKEELEYFPLDSLRMVGTIEQEEQMIGLIRSGEGTLHRVAIDNFMGQNHGRVINISEEGIELIEIVSNGQGGWLERPTKVALAE
jgi:type IV pilus assembly protein PilP